MGSQIGPAGSRTLLYSDFLSAYRLDCDKDTSVTFIFYLEEATSAGRCQPAQVLCLMLAWAQCVPSGLWVATMNTTTEKGGRFRSHSKQRPRCAGRGVGHDAMLGNPRMFTNSTRLGCPLCQQLQTSYSADNDFSNKGPQMVGKSPCKTCPSSSWGEPANLQVSLSDSTLLRMRETKLP